MLGPYAAVKPSIRLQNNLPTAAGSSPRGIPTHVPKLRREYARIHRSLIAVKPEFRLHGGDPWDRMVASFRCGVWCDPDAGDIGAAKAISLPRGSS